MGEIKHAKFKGAPTSRQQIRSKERRGNVDTSKMNAGGFYEGMPGCHLDSVGNRKMIQFVITAEGGSTAEIYAHPKLIKNCIEQSMRNPMLRGIVYAAVTDDMFRNKSIWNWLLRTTYKIRMNIKTRKMEKSRQALIKKIQDENSKEENQGHQNQSEQPENNQG
jgi:hypothetical protein